MFLVFTGSSLFGAHLVGFSSETGKYIKIIASEFAQAERVKNHSSHLRLLYIYWFIGALYTCKEIKSITKIKHYWKVTWQQGHAPTLSLSTTNLKTIVKFGVFTTDLYNLMLGVFPSFLHIRIRLGVVYFQVFRLFLWLLTTEFSACSKPPSKDNCRKASSKDAITCATRMGVERYTGSPIKLLL